MNLRSFLSFGIGFFVPWEKQGGKIGPVSFFHAYSFTAEMLSGHLTMFLILCLCVAWGVGKLLTCVCAERVIYFIGLKQRGTKREKKTEISICWFTSQMNGRVRPGASNSNLVYHIGNQKPWIQCFFHCCPCWVRSRSPRTHYGMLLSLAVV